MDELDHTIRELLERVRKRILWSLTPHGVILPGIRASSDIYGKEGKEPKASDLAALIQLMKERNIKSIFVSPQYSRKMAENLARKQMERS